MMIEIKVLRMERAFFNHGKIIISIFLKDVQYLNKQEASHTYIFINYVVVLKLRFTLTKLIN